MNNSALRFAPTVVILVAAAACAWPYLGGESSPQPVPADAAKAKPGTESSTADAKKILEVVPESLDPRRRLRCSVTRFSTTRLSRPMPGSGS